MVSYGLGYAWSCLGLEFMFGDYDCDTFCVHLCWSLASSVLLHKYTLNMTIFDHQLVLFAYMLLNGFAAARGS